MTEKIPSFKKEIDDIHVPTEKLDEIIINTVKEASEKRKRPIRKKALYSTGAAIIAFGLLLGSAAISPAMANVVAQIPIIGSIFSGSGDRGLVQVSEQGLTNVIGESQVVGGTAITIDEVFYDETRFSIGFSIESEESLEEYYLSSGPDFTINGETVSWGGSYKETEVTPTYRTGLVHVDPLKKLPENFLLDLTFHGKDGKQWDFSLPIQTQTDVKFVAIDHEQKAGGIDLHVTDVKISPAGLLFTFQAESEKMDYLASYLEFKAVDEEGNEIVSHSGGSEGHINKGKEHVTGNRLFDPVDAHVKQLTITPYLMLPTDGGGIEFDQDGNEKEIEFKSRKGEEIEFESFIVQLP
ncbi:DUF4179 domain-containing protein [bacterium LRH843]|nr:DUF4179 domain-containing protein [bacterium LRH843]